MLHHQSRLLQEKAARPFFLSLAEVARRRPLVVLLENVLGLLRVWEKVQKALDRLGPYGYKFGKVPCHFLRQLCSIFVRVFSKTQALYSGWPMLMLLTGSH